MPPGGLKADMIVPTTSNAPVELYHNCLSLCSGKVRVCLAEKNVPYTSNHIHLIETEWYENCSPEFLKVNPGGTGK